VAFRAIADKQAFFYCGFEGYQDTLWDSTGRHYYKSCFIEGAIDFIWGAGASYYEVYKLSNIDIDIYLHTQY